MIGHAARRVGAICAVALVISVVGYANAWAATSGGADHALKLVHAGTLTVGSDTTYPPMESQDPNNPGHFVGADVDLGQALARAIGLKSATFVPGNFDTLITTMLTRHKYDILMSSMNDRPDRRRLGVNFIDYMRASEAILVKKSSSVHASSFAGACGLSVAVEKGTTESDGLAAANKSCAKKITIKTYTLDTEAYNAFAAGHTDAYSGDYPVAALYVKKYPGKYRLAGAAFGATEDYGIAVPKSNTALFSALKAGFAKIRSNGTYMRILKRWNVQGAALH